MLAIEKPRRWNPVGLNEGTQHDGSHPPLYTLELSLTNQEVERFQPLIEMSQEVGNVSLGEMLVERGILSEEQLWQAREVQKSAPGDLGLIIEDLGFATERDVTSARAQELGLQFADVVRYPVDQAAVKSVPEHIARRYNMLPIKRDGNRLMVAISDPEVQRSRAG